MNLKKSSKSKLVRFRKKRKLIKNHESNEEKNGNLKFLGQGKSQRNVLPLIQIRLADPAGEVGRIVQIGQVGGRMRQRGLMCIADFALVLQVTHGIKGGRTESILPSLAARGCGNDRLPKGGVDKVRYTSDRIPAKIVARVDHRLLHRQQAEKRCKRGGKPC